MCSCAAVSELSAHCQRPRRRFGAKAPSAGPDNRVPDADTSRSGGELLPLHPTADDHEIRLELPRLEPLTAGQEVEAVKLLAALFAAAVHRRDERKPLGEAA